MRKINLKGDDSFEAIVVVIFISAAVVVGFKWFLWLPVDFKWLLWLLVDFD